MQCDAVYIIYGMLQPPDDFASLSAFDAAGVLQCVSVGCSVLQCVAVCCSMVQRVTVFRSMFLMCAFNIAILRPRRRVTDK